MYMVTKIMTGNDGMVMHMFVIIGETRRVLLPVAWRC